MTKFGRPALVRRIRAIYNFIREKDDDYLNPASDVCSHYIFTQSKKHLALKSFLNAVIELPEILRLIGGSNFLLRLVKLKSLN